MHVDLAPRDRRRRASPAARAHRPRRRAAVPARGRRPPRGRRRPRRRAGRRRATAHNAEDRAAWEAATVIDDDPWDGPGVHPGKVVADAPPAPARRRDRDHRRRQLRRLGGARLPLPPPGHVPRPHLGRDGLRPTRRRSRRRSSTAIGAVVALVGDGGMGMTPRRGRDRGPRGRARRRDRLRQPALRDDPRPTRTGRAARRRPRRTSGRSTSRPRRGPAARAASGSRTTRRSSRPSGPRSRRPARP